MTVVFHPNPPWRDPRPPIWELIGWLLILIGVIILTTSLGAGIFLIVLGVLVIRHARKPRRFGSTTWAFRTIH